jgi:hypothetical protein
MTAPVRLQLSRAHGMTNTCRGMLDLPIKLGGYTWHDNGGSWAIRQGISRFLIADGGGFSRRIGREMYARLTSPTATRPICERVKP